VADELLHVPPLMPPVVLSDVVRPAHTSDEPVMVPAFGRAFTVTGIEALRDPHKLVSV
jgi:hypothetical protein